MTTTLTAIFDGEVFRPNEPVPLAPNTEVVLTVSTSEAGQSPHSFLRTARSLNLEGPPDWSARVDDYLYGEKGGDA